MAFVLRQDDSLSGLGRKTQQLKSSLPLLLPPPIVGVTVDCRAFWNGQLDPETIRKILIGEALDEDVIAWIAHSTPFKASSSKLFVPGWRPGAQDSPVPWSLPKRVQLVKAQPHPVAALGLIFPKTITCERRIQPQTQLQERKPRREWILAAARRGTNYRLAVGSMAASLAIVSAFFLPAHDGIPPSDDRLPWTSTAASASPLIGGPIHAARQARRLDAMPRNPLLPFMTAASERKLDVASRSVMVEAARGVEDLPSSHVAHPGIHVAPIMMAVAPGAVMPLVATATSVRPPKTINTTTRLRTRAMQQKGWVARSIVGVTSRRIAAIATLDLPDVLKPN